MAVNELNGFRVDQRVEARYEHSDDWKPAKVFALDCNDESYPYQVEFDSSSDTHWTRPGDIRALSVPATRYQYRRVMSSGFSGQFTDWEPLVLSASEIVITVPRSSLASRIEIRPMPAHTTDEILAELRKHAEGTIDPRKIRTILAGEF